MTPYEFLSTKPRLHLADFTYLKDVMTWAEAFSLCRNMHDAVVLNSIIGGLGEEMCSDLIAAIVMDGLSRNGLSEGVLQRTWEVESPILETHSAHNQHCYAVRVASWEVSWSIAHQTYDPTSGVTKQDIHKKELLMQHRLLEDYLPIILASTEKL